MISNREDFERHKKRVYRIRDIQGGLKVWCLTAVERAKFDFNASMREIQSALDELSRRTTEAFAASEKKVNSLFERLEEMKTDYYLRSETFVDEFVVCEGALSGFERMIMHEARSVETVKTMLLEVFAYTDAIQEVKFERGSTPLIFAQINSGASMNYQSNAQIRSGQQAYQPMAEEYKLLSQTGGAEYNQYQANSYGQNSLVGGYSGGSTTVTTYQCSYCKTAFVYSAAYQQRGDGFFLCSQQCKARFEAAYSQSTCTQCKGPIQDKTWWNTGKQQYPGYTENFQFFCSLRCFSGYVPIMPKPVEKKSCAWCEVEVVAKSLLDTSVVQLPCLHMFHDIDCVINYFTACSDNFQMRIDFVCPKCSLQIPSDIVETAVKLRNKKERTVDRLCEKCHIEQFKQVFECGHKLCNNCIKTKEKTFLTILYSTREVCPICGRKERNTLNVHSLKK